MAAIAWYHMEHNAYLGSCYAVVYQPTADEIKADSLRSDFLLALVKTRMDLAHVVRASELQNADLFDPSVPILLRIASECLLGTFGDSHCDCEPQRIAVLREINRVGQGVYVHLPQEAQGQGLYYKAEELHLQVTGMDPQGRDVGPHSVTEAATYLLGPGAALDRRGYSSLGKFSDLLGLDRYEYALVSDSPTKADFVGQTLGLRIADVRDVYRPISVENAGEFLAKLYNKRYHLTDKELSDIYHVLFAAQELPGRVLSLLRYLQEDLTAGKEFRANREMIQMISRIPEEKGLASASITNIDLLRDAESYEEYQIEVAASREELDRLFQHRLFIGIESLRYEVNYFYDLVEFPEVPARSLKIREAFRVADPSRAVESKLIYKIPISERNFRVKAVPLEERETSQLLKLVLESFRRHVVPVLTHCVVVEDQALTVLIKRYNAQLRAVSLMGNEAAVNQFLNRLSELIPAREIPDPTNHRSLDPNLSLGFNLEHLSKEELALFRAWSVG